MQVSAPRTPLCAISMIFCATTLVAGSSIIFKLSALQTLSSAPDISVIVSGSNAFPVFYWFYFSSRMLVSAEGCRSKCSLSGAGWSVIISITKQPASPLDSAGTDQFKHKTRRRPDGRITFHVDAR